MKRKTISDHPKRQSVQTRRNRIAVTDLSGRMRYEQALRESEECCQTFFEKSTDGLFCLSPKGDIVVVNPSFARMHGYTVEELLKTKLRNLDTPATTKLYPARMRTILSGKNLIFEVEHYHKDGHTFPLEVTASKITVGGRSYVLASHRDITQRRKSEEALREAHQRTVAVLESITDGFFGLDRDFRLNYVNREAEKLLKKTRRELLGRILWQVFPEAAGSRFQREYERALATNQTVHFEEYYPPFKQWFEVHAYPSPIGLSVYFNGVTERKRTEKELEQLTVTLEQRVAERTRELLNANERLQVIMDTALIGIIMLDERGTIEFLNLAALNLFGHAPNEILGANISRLISAPDQTPREEFLAHYLQGAGQRELLGTRSEVLGRRKDGSAIMLELSVAEFVDGGRRKFVAMLRNITERKRLERELLEIVESERQRMGNDLHDGLGQHLHGIYYLAALLEQSLREDGSPRVREAGRLHKHLREALELTRGIAHGLLPVKAVPEGLMAALRDLAARTGKLYQVGCRFECLSPVVIHRQSTATHLYHIAQEAVNNAVKHGKPTHIRIRLAAAKQRTVLQIRDNGVGIRRQTKSRKGMGLHIMQYRADAAGGALLVRKLPRRGTEVVCIIRREAAPAQGG